MQFKNVATVSVSLLLALYNICFAQKPKLMLPIGHTSDINSIALSSDSKTLLSASADKTVKLWDCRTGLILLSLLEHSGIVNSAHFSHDGLSIVTASDDKTVKIFNIASGNKTAEITSHTDEVNGAIFNKDDTKILSFSYDYTAKISDSRTGNLLFELKGHKGDITSAVFDSLENFVLTASRDKTAIIWDAHTGKMLFHLTGHTGDIISAVFNNDGKKVLTNSYDGTAKVWETTTGKMLFTLTGHTDQLTGGMFSRDGKKILTSSYDRSAKIWNAENGKLLIDLKDHPHWVESASFSTDGKAVLTQSAGSWHQESLRIWDAEKGILKTTLKGSGNNIERSVFSHTGKSVIGGFLDGNLTVWETEKSDPLFSFTGFVYSNANVHFSNNGKNIITSPEDATLRIWDVAAGKQTETLREHRTTVSSVEYGKSGKKIISAASWDSSAIIRNAITYKPLVTLKGSNGLMLFAHLSADEKKAITVSRNYHQQGDTLLMWDAETGKKLFAHGADDMIRFADFSPDGKKILLSCINGDAKVLDARNGKILLDLKNNQKYYQIYHIEFNNNGKYIAQSGREVKIWDAEDGTLIFKQPTGEKAVFSPDGKSLLIVTDAEVSLWDWQHSKKIFEIKKTSSAFSGAIFSNDGNNILLWKDNAELELWDIMKVKLVYTSRGHKHFIHAAAFSPDDKSFVTSSADNTCILWNSVTGEPLYTFFTVYYQDYLVIDKFNHYDGTEAARKLLYFTCGTEVIELDQVKDQLWVPNLAERIMKGETINAKTLDELNICGLTPEVEDASSKAGEYHFKIKARRGGLGETVLLVNGIEARRYNPTALKKNGEVYDLVINKEELKNFFIAGKENPVTVKAFTTGNAISSRGVKINEDKTKEAATPPNLYAVMIGVSEYKGDELDLKYAAKDATDISAAVGNAAKKLLNADGKEHVFMYNLTTANERYQLPEKNSIKKLLEEIGKKATANDILLIFFAGHGVMTGEADKKQFYFLTADASKAAAASAVADVGISTAELTEWMKPQNIQAQKRILIFDACNSGQAIKDFVKMGTGDQNYIAGRSDDKAQQIKAIDKLNEKSGLFILSASASNQSAYEMGRYSQGLLTYSLLKAIKQQPDILSNGKYLDVSRWFDAAKETVSEISKESGARQDPQIVSNTNFNIGIVDDEVMAKIVLPTEKPLFTASNFQNSDEAADGDNLELSKLVNLQLSDISVRGTDSKIVYVTATNSPDAYTLSGRYDVKNNEVSIRISIKKNNETKYRFEEKCPKNKLKEMVVDLVTKAADWTSANK